MRECDRLAVCHPEFLEDLQYWVQTNRRTAKRLLDLMRDAFLLGMLWPSVEAVVQALADKDKLRTQPAGVPVASMQGLSEQVPAKVVVLTDGISRTVQAGPLQISFKRTTPTRLLAQSIGRCGRERCYVLNPLPRQVGETKFRQNHSLITSAMEFL